MYWANFLHFYQPPTQSTTILQKVTQESYRKVLKGLLQHRQAKLTLNISGCLTEMLAEQGCMDVINQIRTLVSRGQLELTASAKYHPFLPKLPDDQIVRQIQLNTETNRQYFGNLYQPVGFFPPEMGYNSRVGKIVKQLGYRWIILDELASSIPLDATKTYQDSTGMHYFFRERAISFKILTAQLSTARSLITELGARVSQNQYLLTAMDGETFGHHRLGLEELLLELYNSSSFSTVFISELLDLFPESLPVEPQDSSWALVPKDVSQNVPFRRWDDPTNLIHQHQWALTKLVLDLVKKEGPEQQRMVDAALYSDQYWWACAKPWWSLEMIERGAYEFLTAVNTFRHVSPEDQKQVEDLYNSIIRTGFDWQRNGTVDRLSRIEDEEIQARMREKSAPLSKADFTQMITILEKQMLTAADNREYSRAETIQKRLAEVTAEMNHLPINQVDDIKVNQ